MHHVMFLVLLIKDTVLGGQDSGYRSKPIIPATNVSPVA